MICCYHFAVTSLCRSNYTSVVLSAHTMNNQGVHITHCNLHVLVVITVNNTSKVNLATCRNYYYYLIKLMIQ